MAKLTKADLLKRDNISKFVARVNGKGQFKLGDANGKPQVCTGRYKFSEDTQFKKDLNEGDVTVFCQDRDSQRKLMIEVDSPMSAPRMRNFTEFYKDKDMGGVAAKSGGGGSERQELGLIDAINEAVFPTGYVKIPTFRTAVGIPEVISAEKKTGMAPNGKEPYIDVYVVDKRGTKHGVSCKGNSAPSLAGGGVAGLRVVVPELVTKLYATIEDYLKSKGLKDGDVVKIDSIPDLYIKIPNDYVEKILKGTPAMGGPVTHMYVGDMDVRPTQAGSTLNLNGSFYTIEQYQKKIGDFYFRVRKRDVDSEPAGDMKIVYNSKTREGYPKLFEGATRQKNLVRIVIQGSTPALATLLTLKA